MDPFDDNPRSWRAAKADRSLEPDSTGTDATVISILDRLPASARTRRAGASLDIVDRVAERIGTIAGRTRELERYVERFEDWSSAQVDAAEQVADHWRTITLAAETRIDDLQRSLEFSKRRAELAECDLQNVRYHLELLNERIAKVFGTTADTRTKRNLTGCD